MGTAVVAGATGLIGKALVQLLLQDPAYGEVTVLVRRPTGLNHPKLQERVVDYARLEEAGLRLEGADVFCALGTTIKKAGSQEAFRQVDYAYPLALGRLAKAQGAARFAIVTALGANPSSRIFYNRVKGEVEEALRGLALPSLLIFRPSLLLGEREEVRFGERFAAAVAPVISPLMGKYKPIQGRTVAEGMLLATGHAQPGVRVFESREIQSLSRGAFI